MALRLFARTWVTNETCVPVIASEKAKVIVPDEAKFATKMGNEKASLATIYSSFPSQVVDEFKKAIGEHALLPVNRPSKYAQLNTATALNS